MPDARSSAVEYAKEHREATLDLLRDFVRIPSVSLEPGHRHDVRIAADWLAERLRALDHDRVEVFPTGGHPVVYGELTTAGASAPTVLVYGHYDVQPAAPLEAWKTDPFELSTRGPNLHGRGVSDMKGQVIACLAAVQAAISTGSLPVNIKFLIEGEEELGSTHFGDFLTAHKDMLSGDLILVTDVGMLGPDSPTIFYGLRGMYMSKLRVSGPATDLHSGEYGGVVYNPIHALSRLIAGLHEDGRVALPGFYDRVRPITPEEHVELVSLPLNEKDYLEQSGVAQLWGESDYIPVERAGARPAVDVIQFEAGSPKSAIPAKAEALITARLVPDQIPDEVHAQLLCYLEANTPPEVSSEIVEWSGFRASITDRDTAGIQALSWAFETVWGKKPVFYRSGGSIAAVGFMREILGIDSVLTGFSLPDDHVHGANEKIHRPTWERGTDALIHFLFNLRL